MLFTAWFLPYKEQNEYRLQSSTSHSDNKVDDRPSYFKDLETKGKGGCAQEMGGFKLIHVISH